MAEVIAVTLCPPWEVLEDQPRAKLLIPQNRKEAVNHLLILGKFLILK